MVIASNEWLRNSGDDKKPLSGLTTSASPTSNAGEETATALVAPKNVKEKINDEQQGLKNTNSMNAAKSAGVEAVVVGEVVTTEGKATDKELVKMAENSTAKLNDNANLECEPEYEEKEKHENEQLQQHQSVYEKVFKAMTAAGSEYNTLTNESGNLDTSRTTTNENLKDEQHATISADTAAAELENNNRAYVSLIDEIIASGTTGSEFHSIDSNTNALNSSELTVRMSASSGGDVHNSQQTPSTLTTGTDPAILNLLSNAETMQRIASNFANAMSSSGRLHMYGGIDSSHQQQQQQQRTVSSSPSMLLNNSIGGGSNSGSATTTISNNSARNKSASNNSLNNSNSNELAAIAANSNDNNSEAKIILICEKTSHPFETRTISLTPNIECKVGRLIAKCKPSEANAIFDCKVLSRNHAVLWYGSDGKFWVKDTNSSNGTFINDKKLGKDAAELHYGDIVKFGVDVLENSRKEVHGCIIACVKLYLPDGREAISIDNNSPRSQFSGDSRISFDDLHRLNVYMQETSQREKALKAKLYNIQNLLDATRKNSSTCWSAMISEDQLLHRIHSLEKKLQILEKNMPESALKNEIMKLIDDKSAYQHSAKEALRSVYAERCEAMQKLAKLESELAASENESKILREQLSATEDSFQDVNERLRLLETEYKEYQTETSNQHSEAKVNLEQRIDELKQKLHDREEDCEILRSKISNLLAKRSRTCSANSLGADDDKLQKQAIENLDAVIANMDIGDDDDVDDDEVDIVDEDVAAAVREKQKQKRLKSNDVYDFNNSSDSSGNEKQQKSKVNTKAHGNTSQQSAVGEATILKWLQNSDLNKKEGSLDIFKAICSNNESDSSDERDSISPSGTGADTNAANFNQCCTKISTKLQNLKKTLERLETEIILQESSLSTHSKDQQTKLKSNRSEDDDDSSLEYNDANDDGEVNEMEENPRATEAAVQTLNGQSVQALKSTIQLFSEVYEEIFDNFKKFKAEALAEFKTKNTKNVNAERAVGKFKKVKGANTVSTANTTTTLTEIDEADSEDENDDATGGGAAVGDDDNFGNVDDDDDEQNSVTTKSEVSTIVNTKNTEQQTIISEEQQRNEIETYQKQIEQLQSKLNEQQHNAEHTMEVMHTECENYKEKIAQLTLLNKRLRGEVAESGIKENVAVTSTSHVHGAVALNTERGITNEDFNYGDAVSSDSGVSSIGRTMHTTANSPQTTAATTVVETTIVTPAILHANEAVAVEFEQQTREELAAINSSIAQREEELIAYKEILERTEKENLLLRDKIMEIQQKIQNGDDLSGGIININGIGSISKSTLMRYTIPMGIVAFGIIAYLFITYL